MSEARIVIENKIDYDLLDIIVDKILDKALDRYEQRKENIRLSKSEKTLTDKEVSKMLADYGIKKSERTIRDYKQNGRINSEPYGEIRKIRECDAWEYIQRNASKNT